MFNLICKWFAKRYIPSDSEIDLANALFNWKHKK
jgi:hypothetical protein